MSNAIGKSGWTRRDVLRALGAGAAAAALPHRLLSATEFPKGAVIRTILRDYAPDELAGGATLFHEHMSLAPDFLFRIAKLNAETKPPAGPAGVASAVLPSPTANSFMQDLDLLTDEMTIARREGIACIVDGGHPDMGRDINFLRRLSQQSGMPIVAGAGFYTQPFYPHEISSMSEEQVFQAIMKQVHADPIGAFGEIGAWDYISKDERKVFRAVGKAHLATNIPIFTHTAVPGKSALEQLDILEDAGVDPRRVAIGHLGNLVDPAAEVHRAICRRGAFIGFDRMGGLIDEPIIPVVMALIEAGFADNLLFSSDLAKQEQLKRSDQAMGYARTLTAFVPKLKKAGAIEVVLRQIMNDNPRRFLAFVPKIKRKG